MVVVWEVEGLMKGLMVCRVYRRLVDENDGFCCFSFLINAGA